MLHPNNPLLTALQSQNVGADSSLSLGQSVLADWNGDIYPAKIERLLDDGRVEISYDDYDSTWNEVVGRDRLRLSSPPMAPCLVTIWPSGAPPQTGHLARQVGEFFELVRFDDGRRVFIAEKSVTMIEVLESAPPSVDTF